MSYLKPGVFVQAAAPLRHSSCLSPPCLPLHLLLLVLLGFGIRAAGGPALRSEQTPSAMILVLLLPNMKAHLL